MKLITSPNCNTANCNEIETIHNRHIPCRSKHIFWKDPIYWWQQHIGNLNHLTMQNVILGIHKVLNVLLNYCIWLGKCFIYIIHSQSPGKQIEFIAKKTISVWRTKCIFFMNYGSQYNLTCKQTVVFFSIILIVLIV